MRPEPIPIEAEIAIDIAFLALVLVAAVLALVRAWSGRAALRHTSLIVLAVALAWLLQNLLFTQVRIRLEMAEYRRLAAPLWIDEARAHGPFIYAYSIHGDLNGPSAGKGITCLYTWDDFVVDPLMLAGLTLVFAVPMAILPARRRRRGPTPSHQPL